MNSGVAARLKLKGSSFSIVPSVATEDFSDNTISKKENFHIISVGRFVPLKGFDLTILSFIAFLKETTNAEKSKCKLTLVGTGPEKKYYEKLIRENNVSSYIEIIEWIDRKELMEMYKKAAVFLFPSHEGAGMVVAEALSFGLPVVCLDNEGPGEFINKSCGFAIKIKNYDNTVLELKNALKQLHCNPDLLFKMSCEARKKYEETFTWNSRGKQLNAIYNTIRL